MFNRFVCLFFLFVPVISYGEYVSSLADIDYKGTVTYKNNGYTFSKEYFSEENFQPVISKAHGLMSFEDDLRDQIRDEILGAIEGDFSLDRYNFDISGPIRLSLDGLANGVIAVTLNGFSVEANIKIEKSWYANGYVDLYVNNISISGEYDISTGRIFNLGAATSSIQVDIDLDTIFDLIPGFNSLVTNNIEDDISESIKSSIEDELNSSLSSQERTLFGLNQAVPSSVYVYQGLDLGQEIKNSLFSLFSGESLVFEISQEDYRYKSQFDYKYFTAETVKLSISDNLFIEITEVPRFRTYWQSCSRVGPCFIEP